MALSYMNPPPVSRAAVEQALRDSGDVGATAEAVISAALHDDDAAWVEGVCGRALLHASMEVRRAGVIGLGHAARRFRILSSASRSMLERLRLDRELAGSAEDALDDVRMFANRTP
jgi:hypothetical protein